MASFRPPPTSESVCSELQKLHAKMNEFRHIMGDSTQKHLDTVIKYGIVFSELDPRSKAVFGVLSLTFELLKEQKKRDQSVSDLASQLKRIFPFASKSLEEAIDDNTDLLRKTIGSLYTLTIDVAEFTYDYVKRNRFKRLGKSIISTGDEEKITELTSEFNAIVGDFGRAVDIETLKTVRGIEETMLLDRLQPLQAGYSQDRRCMEGTRVALLDDILDWAIHPIVEDESPSRNVYWLYGIPGIGKTAMANSICARLHEAGRLGGAFFCRRDDPKLSDPKYVLPTLVCKLAKTWGGYRKVVADRLRKDPHLDQNSAGNELFLRLLESLQSRPPYPLVLVIDALDECGDISVRRQILTTLLDASLRVPWIRIVITSRQERDIESTFTRPQYMDHYSSKDLATEDSARKDIALFARSKLMSVADRDDWPGDDKLSQIVDRSGGLFIFVETLWRLLQEGLDRNRCLDQALSGESSDALDGLYRLYSTAISTKIGKEKEIFRLVIGTIIVVGQYRPLPDESIAQLVGLDVDIVITLVNKLGSLLYRDAATNGGIRVRHLSVIDFLTSTSTSEEIQVDVNQVNRNLGIFCLRVMTQGLRFNICNLESSFIRNRDIPDLASRIKLNISMALEYSCLYWAAHLSHSPDTGGEDVYSSLERYTEDCRLLYWIEVVSLIGKAHEGEWVLRRILSWIKLSTEPLVRRINDALKFVLMFREPIITSTPHIYVSGLAFIPTDTYICNNGAKLFQEILKVEKGRLRAWATLPDVLRGHSGSVYSVSYSPDGRYIASGSGDKTIRIWDAESGVSVGEPLKGHDADVLCVAYSPDGFHIASGSSDQTLRIWDTKTGAAVSGPLKGHTNSIRSIAYSPDGCHIASGSSDRTIRIWDAGTGAAVGEPLKGHNGWICGVAYSPDGCHIASGCDEAEIRIWDAKTGAAVGKPLMGHTRWVRSVAYSPNSLHIASGAEDNTIRIWDAKTGAAVGEPLKGHTGHVQSVAYSPNGQRIASGSNDGSIRIWDAKTGAAIGGSPKESTSSIYSVSFSPDGRHIVSGAINGPIRIWDANTGAAVGESLRGHEGDIDSLAFSPDGLYIASGSSDRTIRIWDAKTGAAVNDPLSGHTGYIRSIAYSPDGCHIASGSSDQTIRIWDTKTGTTVSKPLKGHKDYVDSIAYSPDGRHIASGSWDQTIRIWDAKTGAPVSEDLTGHTDRILSIEYSPDGLYIASGSQDTTIRIWDTKIGAIDGEPLRLNMGYISTIAYSPDGLHIASGSNYGTIRILDVKTRTVVGESQQKNNGGMTKIAYSPNGLHLVSCSWGYIHVWDAKTGASVGEPLIKLTHSIHTIAYSPDSRYIASGSWDKIIRIWDTALYFNSQTDANAVDLTPDSHGWVHHPDGGLWFWVPEDCRHGLLYPAILTIPPRGPHRAVKVDVGEFAFGRSWTNIKMVNL